MEKGTLEKRWSTLDGKKGDLHDRSEKYSMWTLPYLYPETGTENEELETDLDSIGARAVNHLSNKLTNTLFPAYKSFMRLELEEDVRAQMVESGVPEDLIDKSLIRGEKTAIRSLDKMGHRNSATEAAKYLIVTGNALMYYPEDAESQVYSTRDFCVLRDLSGNVLEILTVDTKAFETFDESVQEELKAGGRKDKTYEEGTDVHLYTQIKLNGDTKKFEVKQAADMIMLEGNSNTYAPKDLPWKVLSWNRVRGEDYGRGMVEDYRGAFGAIEVLSRALMEGVVTAATLKFLVNPSSVIDVVELNNSANGTFHAGRDGDITTINSDKHLDFQQVKLVLEDYQRQIAQAFLLNSSVTRDAERVTAEEIREQAQELEMAFGGIYSRFTRDWQMPLAMLLLSRQNIKINDQVIYPVIVTGLDTLTRLGDLDNFRMFVNDLAMVGGLPPEIAMYVKKGQLITWIGNNRGLDYDSFIKTEEEVAGEQEAQMQAQKDLMAEETGNDLAKSAGQELVKQDV